MALLIVRSVSSRNFEWVLIECDHLLPARAPLGICRLSLGLVAAGSGHLVGCEQGHGTGSKKAKPERKDADDTYG